jgi:ParB family chromosome partitioning protein
MLGKGLESLIPPNQKSADADYGSGQAPSNSGQSTGEEAAFDKAAVQSAGQPQVQSPSISAPDIVSPVQNPTPAVSNTPSQEKTVSVEKEKSAVKKPAEAIFHIEVDKIKPNPYQPRRSFSEEGINELAASIREFGMLQPLVVTKIEKEVPTGTEIEYQLIAGERRWLAAKKLGLETVPAIIKNIDLERERLEMAVVENIQRENLNPIETARAFAKLQDEFHLTQREIASRLGKSREVVANTLRLLDLPPYIQEAISAGQISESHGRLLLTISDTGTQQKLFNDLVQNRLTTRELKNRVRPIRGKGQEIRDKEFGGELSPELKMFQEKLSSELGAPVTIYQRGESGKITITFYSPEELRNILNRLGKED